MLTLTVDLGPRSYPIHMGPQLLPQANALLKPHLNGQQLCIVTNETVAPLYLPTVCEALDGYRLSQVVLPDGEQFKTVEMVNRIYDALLGARVSRNGAVIALGGGVIGDMAGYAAATYQRGIDFIQMPTTLLAQVDSSVGGKTGVNHPLGKNMIGAFHQPRCVLADTDTLKTLPPRELSAGLAEVVKYALIRDAAFFDWLDAHLGPLLTLDADALMAAIARSCRHKAAIVAADEREVGERALLNLGHTFGHAIETALGYGAWLHGEAVAVGMVMAARLSAQLGWLTPGDIDRLEDWLARAGLPTAPPALSPARWRELMAVDKKNQDGQLRLILLTALGQGVVWPLTDAAALNRVLETGHET